MIRKVIVLISGRTSPRESKTPGNFSPAERVTDARHRFETLFYACGARISKETKPRKGVVVIVLIGDGLLREQSYYRKIIAHHTECEKGARDWIEACIYLLGAWSSTGTKLQQAAVGR